MKQLAFYDLSNDNFTTIIEKCEGVLTPKALIRCQKYHCQDDYARSLVAWVLLQKLLKLTLKLDLKDLIITENAYGKPLLKETYFSISHSLNLVMVMIDDEIPCGVDVEWINPNLTSKKLLHKILGNEVELTEEMIRPCYVTRLWTIIEVNNKIIGCGNRFDQFNINENNIETILISDGLNNKYYYAYSSFGNSIKITEFKDEIYK